MEYGDLLTLNDHLLRSPPHPAQEKGRLEDLKTPMDIPEKYCSLYPCFVLAVQTTICPDL